MSRVEHLLNDLLRFAPIWGPLLAGAAAIFLLLPRPRAYPVLWGVLAAGAALLLAGFLLVRLDALTPEAFLFYAFSAIAVVSGGLLITQRNPARAALSFTLVVLSTCGLFLLLAAPFLMAATIIIYAGAIVVTFLFVLMLAQQLGLSDADARSREPLLATITGFVLLGALLYVLQMNYPRQPDEDLKKLRARAAEAASKETVAEINDLIGANPEEGTLFKDYRTALKARGLPNLVREVSAIEDTLNIAASADQETLAPYRTALRKLEDVALAAEGRAHAPSPPEGAPLSNLSGPPANVHPGEVRRDKETGRPHVPAENSAYLGRSLFTDFLLPVELAGTLLLVATIGAIAIAHRRASAIERAP